jgi:G3E family GTPase
MPKQDNKRIEMYLVHGTLGSGKTSFISHLADSEYFKNSYIIENEFANQNIDKTVLDEHFHAEDIIGISGGCICCSTGNELMEALNKIFEVNIHKYPVILETTGVANSVQLLKKLFLNNDFNSSFQLKRNILIIDLLENSLENLKDKVLDINLADTIILNKGDLVNEVKKEEIKSFVKDLNKEALVLESIKGKVDFNALLNDKVLADIFVTKHFDELISFTEINHEGEMSYEILSAQNLYDKDTFELRIKSLLEDFEVFRIKGYFKDQSNKFWHIEATKNNIEITPAKNTGNLNIVIIGKNIKNIKL